MSRLATTATGAALLAALALVAVAAPAGAAAAPTACRGSALSGSFSEIAGSAGAGHISYRLRVRNTSGAACYVAGVPKLVLLGAAGKALPTSVERFNPGKARHVVLAPGGYASLTARFSPSVAGPGEPVDRQCEPTATRLRATPGGGGSLTVPIVPPTPVCVSGHMLVSSFSAGRNSAEF